jgi:hypothetical protein
MLITAKTLKGYKLHCTDGEIGTITEFVFDDRDWVIRYFVVETGTWLVDRQVLISVQALTAVDEESKFFTANLTKKQIEESPLLYKDAPVTRQYEEQYNKYYGLPTYWNGPSLWGTVPNMLDNTAAYKEATMGDTALEPDLRSTDNVSGHRVHATDGDIGHIIDFIIDDEAWVIRYLVVSTHNWLPGKKVLISPRWIDHIGWGESTVFVCVLREKVKQAPEYSDACVLNRDYEEALHNNYDREGYWNDKAAEADKKID